MEGWAGVLVGLCVERLLEMVIGLLAANNGALLRRQFCVVN
jgi:hypothetical protein